MTDSPAAMQKRLHPLILFVISLLFCSGLAVAQGLTIDITNGNPSALPVAVVPFAYQGSGTPPEFDVGDIVRADLARSGKFRTLPKADVVEFPSRGSEVKFATWKLLRQDYLVIGRVLDGADGTIRAEYEAFLVGSGQGIASGSISGQRSAVRDIAHQIADAVYEKITGIRGAFWTRVAYVTAVGVSPRIQYQLMVADSDGYNPQTLVRSAESLMSPSWSPDGRKLAYVSFESGNSAVYVQDLTTGMRQLVSSNRGINAGPAFSPDGRKLSLTLSFGGNPEIYVLDLATKTRTQITRHMAIDVESAWTPDGQSILFTSDRSGKPQIYQAPATGGEATRITFQGQYNARVSVCCDGKQLAMVQGSGNVYRIAVVDRGTGQYTQISPGNQDESPSFAPNGSMVIYAASEGSRGVLYSASADGRVRQRLVLANGDVREPAWGPFRQR